MSNLASLISYNSNPYTGVFGTGKTKWFMVSDTFTIPTGITSVRVRVWGNGGNAGTDGYGGYNGGGGGGFAMKTITGLTPGGTVSVTIGTSASSTNSFGAYCSATGGSTRNGSAGSASGGAGSGGDINYTGGAGGAGLSSPNYYAGGGGVANYFGNGGDGAGSTNQYTPKGRASGGGGMGLNATSTSGAGSMFSSGGTNQTYQSGTGFASVAPPTTGNPNNYIDFIGVGGGGYGSTSYGAGPGVNGGGGGGGSSGGGGGFPGGGGGSTNSWASGLVIVEY